MKLCSKCKIVKSVSEFGIRQRNKDGLNTWCKVCNAENTRKNYKNNDGALRERNRKRRVKAIDPKYFLKREQLWKARNKDIVQTHRENYRSKLVGRIKAAYWQFLCRYYDYKCVCCRANKPLQMDHIIPLSKDGKHSIENIQPLCKQCNASKRNWHSTNYMELLYLFEGVQAYA